MSPLAMVWDALKGVAALIWDFITRKPWNPENTDGAGK